MWTVWRRWNWICMRFSDGACNARSQPLHLTHPQGSIVSPNFDQGDYPNDSFCQWIVNATLGYVRLLHGSNEICYLKHVVTFYILRLFISHSLTSNSNTATCVLVITSLFTTVTYQTRHCTWTRIVAAIILSGRKPLNKLPLSSSKQTRAIHSVDSSWTTSSSTWLVNSFSFKWLPVLIMISKSPQQLLLLQKRCTVNFLCRPCLPRERRRPSWVGFLSGRYFDSPLRR